MNCILYYSKHCEHSKNLIEILDRKCRTKYKAAKDLHFICVDRRIIQDDKTFIVLENNQKIILPETVKHVPALLLVNDKYEGYKVLLGEDILLYLRYKQIEIDEIYSK